MSARGFASVLWRRKLVALVVAAVVVLAGFGFLSTQHKVYESTSSVALLPPTNNPSNVQSYANLVPTLVPSYMQLVSSPSFLSGVASTLPFTTTGDQLGKQVHAEAVPNAGIIKIVADLPDARQAQQVAQATTQAFISNLSSQNNNIVSLAVFNRASVPTSPVSPRPKLVIGATIALAIILALTAALVWERLFGRIFDPDDLTEASGLPVIGVIPEERRLREGVRVVIGQAGMSRVEDALRSLRTNFVFATSGSKLRSVAVTSVSSEEGKSTIAINLAVVVAELGLQVVLIDGDTHRPKIHQAFGFDNSRGLSSTVLEGASPRSLLRPAPAFPGLQVVTSGPPVRDRGEEAMLYLQHLSAFAGLGDVVIVDSPPLRAGADVRLLATATDAVLLAARSGKATPRQVRGAVHSLRAVDARVIGTVLSRAREVSDIGESVAYYPDYREAAPVGEIGS